MLSLAATAQTGPDDRVVRLMQELTDAPSPFFPRRETPFPKQGPNQTIQATVRSVNQKKEVYEEVELRLPRSLSPHRATGYEIDFRCSKTEKAYSEIVRWNGPLGDFTYLKRGEGSRYGVKNGDVAKATIGGDLIRVYVNGVQALQVNDDTYKDGSPGMGFYIQESTRGNDDCGFTSFEASDLTEPSRAGNFREPIKLR